MFGKDKRKFTREDADALRESLRLERIATAAMAAIISKHPALNEGDDEYHCVAGMVARGAIDYAKALIAELDAAK